MLHRYKHILESRYMDSYLSTAQVAVMNQNPATSEFGPAPFLPPPPGKAGRKQEPAPAPALAPGGDRYAVFDSVQPSDTYTHNNNILQQQQQQQPGFGNTFLDEGVYLQILYYVYSIYNSTSQLCGCVQAHPASSARARGSRTRCPARAPAQPRSRPTATACSSWGRHHRNSRPCSNNRSSSGPTWYHL